MRAEQRLPRTTIPSTWLALRQGKPLTFWLRVAKRVKAQKVRRNDLQKIATIIGELEHER